MLRLDLFSGDPNMGPFRLVPRVRGSANFLQPPYYSRFCIILYYSAESSRTRTNTRYFGTSVRTDIISNAMDAM